MDTLLLMKKKKWLERDYIQLQRNGIRKTAVDRMAAMTDISKGSFYNFYSPREMIFTALTLPEELLIESLHTEKA